MDQIVAQAGNRVSSGARNRAVVVGAGFGGIASALRLSAKGYRVTLLDRAPMLGGRAQVFEKDGFKHDAGPTVITAPFLFDELFELFGKKSDDYFTLKPLTPWYRFYFDEDGSTFDYGGTLEETLAAMRAIDPLDGDGYLRMLDHSKALFDAGFTNLADQPFHNPLTMVGQIPRLVQLGSYRSVWDFVTKYFHSPKIRQALSIQPLLVGGSPFDTTSIYGLIHYLERKWGVFYAEGGTGAIVAALGKLMEEEGVNIRLNTTVCLHCRRGRNGDRRAAREWHDRSRGCRCLRRRPHASFRRHDPRPRSGLDRAPQTQDGQALDGLVPDVFRDRAAISRTRPTYHLARRALQGIAGRHLQAESAGGRFLALHSPANRYRPELRARGLRRVLRPLSCAQSLGRY